MDKRNIFIGVLTYTGSNEQVDALLTEHRVFLQRYIDSGNLIVCGRQNPRTGGVIIGYADSRDHMEEILQEDPFYINGIATHSVIEFTPTRWRETFANI